MLPSNETKLAVSQLSGPGRPHNAVEDGIDGSAGHCGVQRCVAVEEAMVERSEKQVEGEFHIRLHRNLAALDRTHEGRPATAPPDVEKPLAP